MQHNHYTLSRPFQGRLLRGWASTIESDQLAKVRNAVRQGYMEGKTVAQIVNELNSAGHADLVGGAQ
ncbi:hypothetical protein [Pseudomonas pseudonitroreducens]|uniref:hypothetical protein n=1 Tax=Pseudomonas pseudonitroreducens TaxID=2892326 RepID=UPI001F2F1A6F|nr:hypothetical protein [Pseudomonas pseudonitroreducens]